MGNFLGLAACAGALAFASFYLQDEPGFESCPLCTLTRVILLIMAVLFAIGWVFNPRVWLQRLLASLNLLFVVGGIATSVRHIWLSSLTTANCSEIGVASVEYRTALQTISDAFRGIGHCTDSPWSLLGLQVPHLALALFVGLLLLVWRQLRKKVRRSYFN